jgi:hypothetical protein
VAEKDRGRKRKIVDEKVAGIGRDIVGKADLADER